MAELDPKALEAAIEALDATLHGAGVHSLNGMPRPTLAGIVVTAYLSTLSPQEAAPGAVGVRDGHLGGISCWNCRSSFDVWFPAGVAADYSLIHKLAGELGWVIGHSDGQGHYGCPDCAITLFDAGKLMPDATVLPSGQNETGGEPPRDGSWVDLRTTLRPRVVARWGRAITVLGHDQEGWVDSDGFWVLEEGEEVVGLAASGERNAVVEAADGLERIDVRSFNRGADDAFEKAAIIAALVRVNLEAQKHGKSLNQIDEHVASVADGIASRIRALKETPNA